MTDHGTGDRTDELYHWLNTAAVALPLHRLSSRLELQPDTPVVLRYLLGTQGDSVRVVVEWVVPDRLPFRIDLTGNLPLLDTLDHAGLAWTDSENMRDINLLTPCDATDDGNEPPGPSGRAKTYLIRLVDAEHDLALITYVDHDEPVATLNQGILSYARPRVARRQPPSSGPPTTGQSDQSESPPAEPSAGPRQR